ncbi:unnamed protein product [Ixodes hexagonus]
MARLRFPGCPGQRIGRNVVTYEENRNRLQCDPSLSVVSNIQRSLSSFYELFGASDEDEEFGGFSAWDARKTIQKLGHYNDDISSGPSSKDEPSSSSKTVALRSTSKLVGRTSNLPPDPGGRANTRDSKVPKLEKASRVRCPETPSSAGQTKGEGARKKPGRQAARRLLDRAKRGCAWTGKEERSERGGAALALKIGCFQLPAVSARSSRRIIPRKRYLEDSEDDAPQLLQKRKPVSQLSVEAPGDSPVVVLERLTAKEERTAEDGRLDADRDAELEARLGGELGAEMAAGVEGEPGTSGTTRVGLFDRPLVVQGKRPWKPSLKVQMRLSEANLGSPFAFRGGSGSSHGGSRTSSDSCCRESIKRDMVSRYAEIMATKEDTVEVPANSPPGTTGLLEDKVAAKIERLLKSQWENRLQGGSSARKKNVVLRKARLRLSQRTLRRLRQPLDESPGEEGPRETREQSGATEAVEARTRRERPHINGVKRERGASLSEVSQCAVCGQSKPPADITVKYGQRSCRFCFCFYNRFLKKPKKFRCTGEVPGTCNLAKTLKCKGCLLHACWTLFEIPATQKRRLQRHLIPLGGGPKRRHPARKRRSSETVGEGGLGAECPSEMPKPVLSSPEDSQDTHISSSDSSKVSKGPRIKHVCRRAAVVLGHERATFSPPSTRISLSALSEEDKNLLVRSTLEAEKTTDAPVKCATSSEVASDAKTSVTSRKPRKHSLALQRRRLLAQPLRRYKSRSEQYRLLLLHTAAKKAKSKSKPKVTSKARAAMLASRVAREKSRPKGGLVAKRETDDSADQCGYKLEGGMGCDAAVHATSTNRECDRDAGGTMHCLDRVGGASSLAGKLQDKLQPKAYPPLVPKVVEHPLSSRQLSKKSVGHGNQPLVQSLFGEEEYRRAQIIATGFALVSSRRFAVQAVCFLCASAGEEELLFCTVCCEPYHWFCLDPEEAPQGLDKESWCCPRCQTCIACGHRSSQLLRCSKCQQTYHTDCLGPGYPSKPSRKKKIWLCVKCIRCKSCGTSSKQSAWNFDLSLCQDCMLLREKGNYCPLCEKCYEDDDYESMMVQCSQCQKWIHARCDGISEELYQVLSLLPETELYLCRICEPNSPRLWLGTAERVLQDRLRCIMNSLLELQKASKDKCQVLEQAVPTPPDLLMLPDEATDRDPALDSVQPPAVWRNEIHFVDLIAVQRKLECGEYTAVKEFCEDILQAAIASRVSVQMVRELLAKLLEDAFPGLRPSPLPPTPPHEPSDMPCGLLPDAVLPPHADHVYAQYLPKEDSPPIDQPGVLRGCEQGSLADSRRCVLCGQPGDDACTRSGRLIYAGQDDWVHVNCALWSAEVFEHVDGSLHRVHSAIWRGRCLRCEVCGNVGATVGCCVRGCPANFHFGCARAAQAVFQADRRVFCTLHQGNINREVVDGDKFAVCHAVYISQQDVNSKWQKAWQEKIAKGISVITGSMTIESLGHLTEASDLESVLVPINYRCRRLFWSTQNPRQRVVYTCRTYEVRPPRPSPEEEDLGVNVTTAHTEEPYAPPPYPPPREGPQCDIASASCDSSRVGAVSSSDAFDADAPSQSSPDLDDLDAKILDELAKCVQGNDSHLDFAELLENISRSCDPAKGCGGGSGVNSSAGGDSGASPAPDQQSADVQPPPQTRQNSAVVSAKAVVDAASSSPSEELKQDCAKVSTEARAGATAPQQPPVPPVSRGGNTNQSQKCAKPVVKQPQSSCSCTCEGRAMGRTAGKVASTTTPSRARSRPAASPKTILPKVAGSAQSCQRQQQQQQQQQVAQTAPQAPCMGLPSVAQPPPLDLSRLVSYSPYAYNIPVINQFPSTINMTSVSCDKFEVYEVPGGTIIIPRHHYRLENCVSTLSVAGAQVAYLGSLPLVAAPFMQPAATPLTFIGGLGGQAPVMPLALQPPTGVCGQVPLVAGSGLVANPGMVGPGLAASNLVASMTSSTMVNNISGGSGLAPPCQASSMQRMAPCCAADQRKKTVVTQKQCTKAVMVRNRVVHSSRSGGKSVVTQSRSSYVSQQQCTKCVVMPERSPSSVAVSEPPKVSEAGPAAPAVSTTEVQPAAVPPAAQPPPPTRSTTSPDLYPEPDSSTAEDLFSGPGRMSPNLLPPPQPPFSPSPQASPRGAGDSGSLGAESIFALLQKAAQRILQDGWPTDADTDPVPPAPPPPLPLEAKEPVHSTVNLPPPLPHSQESQERVAPFDRPYIVYEISSEDGFLHSSHDVHEAWRYVFEKLQDARAAANLQPLTADDVDGFSMMGLTHKTVVYLTEQLRGADNCINYRFKFHKRNCVKLSENPSGCARLEQFESRGDHDMFKFLASAHRCPPRYDPSENGDEVEVLHKSSRRLTSLDLPMAMRFRHLKNTAKEAVGVYRSSIHGRGLYCKRNIDGGEMIIEYAGEVIRAALTDKREKYYESKGIGCYMFRIDDHEVVDATMHGNAARFINHSCEPNCYSKVITVDNKKHIVIFALRSILKGEELTYDYKFPIEEVKIPCSCGSRRCRKFLN